MGTVPHSKHLYKSYGSFNDAKYNVAKVKKDIIEHISPDEHSTIDNDSGMSSGENEESLKCSLSNKVTNNVNMSVDDKVIKCLTNENQRAVHWNEIPCCSKDVTYKNVINEPELSNLLFSESNLIKNDKGELMSSDFVVINLKYDVDTCDSAERIVGTNIINDCDNLNVLSVDSSQSLVPVANNEIVKSENQKLVSLSLSILLAAILQAMRCFAQFLEDIVAPQRL